MLFAVVNQSTMFTDVEAKFATSAINAQMRAQIAPAWNRLPAALVFFPKNVTPPPEAQQLVILDHADQADALGYHDETPDGYPYARIFCEPVLQNGGATLSGGDPSVPTISSVLSHEASEQFVDPSCNAWIDGPFTIDGVKYAAVALEVADPVEADGYFIRVGTTTVTVSNFVFPAWFDAQAHASARFDQLSLLQAPFTMTDGGYMIVRNKLFAEGQVFAEHRAAWRAATKNWPAARSARRGVLSFEREDIGE